MSYGEVWKKDIFSFTRKEDGRGEANFPIEPQLGEVCCYKNEVYAYLADENDIYRNDFTLFKKFFPSVDTILMQLQKNVNGTWTDILNLTGNNVGILYNLAIKNYQQLAAYQVNWFSVLFAYGEGEYRVKWTQNVITQYYSESYCLKNYNNNFVNGTTRINYLLDSVIGGKSQVDQLDYAGYNLMHQVRIKNSVFGYKTAPFTNESVRYESGMERLIKQSFREEYLLEIYKAPMALHDILLYEVGLADKIWIDDYNASNISGQYVNKQVIFIGNYSPNYRASENPPVMLTFTDAFTNRQKFYS